MPAPASTIHCGDNLDIMNRLPAGSVDLCYVDPPFFSRRNHVDHARGTAEVRGFKDTWNGDIDAYIEFMKARIAAIHRLLRDGGSFYLHCDVSAVFHLKVACDGVFGIDNFLTDIIWKRHSPSKNTDRNYGNIVDHVLFYAKGPGHTFNVQHVPMDESVFNLVEEGTGRKFRSQPLVVKGTQEGKTFRFGDRSYTIKKGKALKWSQETIDTRLARNPDLIYWTGGGEPRYKTYLDESKGIKLTSLWTDVKLVTSTSSERLAYPTQKPVKLLERVVSVSSNPGDLVLDAFCGSGTTLVAARNLGRRYAGIDASPTACRLAASRLGYPVDRIVGHPSSGEEFDRFPPFELVNWACWQLNARQVSGPGTAGIDATCRQTRVPVVVHRDGVLEPGALAGLVEVLGGRGEGERAGAVVAARVAPGIDDWVNRIRDERGVAIHVYTVADLLAGRQFRDGVSVMSRLA